MKDEPTSESTELSDPASAKTALVSVWDDDKTSELADLVRALINQDWTVYASGGTKKFLDSQGCQVIDTADLTGLKPCLDHRVATLTPQLHGGLLAEMKHAEELSRLKWYPIGLVICTFYPLIDAMKKTGASDEEINKQVDIGGPTLIRSGCKGNRTVITHSRDFAWLRGKIEVGSLTQTDKEWTQAMAAAEISAYVAAEAVFRLHKLRSGSLEY